MSAQCAQPSRSLAAWSTTGPRTPRRNEYSALTRQIEEGLESSRAKGSGRSRGRRVAKIHAAADGRGQLLAFVITPGQRGDARVALALVGAVPPPKICVADTAYDSRGIRQMLIEDRALPVIPNNPTRKNPQPFDRKLYRLRNAIERMFCRLKDWRRLATRYDRLNRNFEAAVALAALLCFWL